MHPKNILLYVFKPALKSLEPEIPYSPAALRLCFGTALHESGNFTYIDQYLGSHDVTLGPAFGICQCEMATVEDMFNNFLSAKRFQTLKAKVMKCISDLPDNLAIQIASDMHLAAVLCRVHYYRVSAPLPATDDIWGLAEYWKKYYNTVHGKGKPEQFVEAVQHYELKYGPITAA